MSTATNPSDRVDRLFLVTGTGRDVFLGASTSEGDDGELLLEGKTLALTVRGRLIVRPFSTTLALSLVDPNVVVHRVRDTFVIEEARRLLGLSATHVHRSSAPRVFAWVESVAHAANAAAPEGVDGPRVGDSATRPFESIHATFLESAEEFRRVLFHARQVDSTRELDQVTELEGDLAIDIGRAANQAAVKLNALLQRERELDRHLEAFRPRTWRATGSRVSMNGWPYLYERLQLAKAWARRQGKTELVRAINAIVKDATFALNEVIHDHGNSLDTLITETFGQYGIDHDFEAGLEDTIVPWAPSEEMRGTVPHAGAPHADPLTAVHTAPHSTGIH